MTFSIVAFDQKHKNFGVAITTSSIAVGSRCPWVQNGVGAVSTQNVTDPSLGPEILYYLEDGLTAGKALYEVVNSNPFMNYRQLIVVDKFGETAHHTGENILGTHAVSVGKNCIAAGNLLANENVPAAMTEAFEKKDSNIHLAESLLKALQVGIDAGGEMGTVHSAALLTAGEFSFPEVNLRVDWHESSPVDELRKLWEAYEPQRQDYILRAVVPSAAPSYGVPGDP